MRQVYAGLVLSIFSAMLMANGDSNEGASSSSAENSSQINSSQLSEILALQADIDYGEYIAGECLTCHSVSAHDKSIPVIHGSDKKLIVEALLAYQQGVRENSVMRSVASNLSDEEIAAVATFFNAQ